jgi:hypothetical protein
MEAFNSEDIYLLVIMMVVLLAFLAVYIFFLIEQQNILKAIRPENRLMRPGQVWLQLIPLFNVVWQFIVVGRISDSIQREFATWENDSIVGLPDAQVAHVINTRPTYDIGLAYCILYLCNWIPFVGTLAGIAGLVCWVIYWTKLVEFRRKIERRF